MPKKRSSNKPLYNPDDEKSPKKWEYVKKPKLCSPKPSDKDQETDKMDSPSPLDMAKFDLSNLSFGDNDNDLNTKQLQERKSSNEEAVFGNIFDNPSSRQVGTLTLSESPDIEGLYSFVALSLNSITYFFLARDPFSEDISFANIADDAFLGT